MNESMEKRVVGFLATLSERCCRCGRRVDENCRRCAAGWANELLADYRRDRGSGADCSLAVRETMIVDALARAYRPLRSADIALGGICTPQLKRWTLLRMVRRGIVRRRAVRAKDGRSVYFYCLTRKATRLVQEQKGEKEKDEDED